MLFPACREDFDPKTVRVQFEVEFQGLQMVLLALLPQPVSPMSISS
jgi:hypothetical protein